MRIEMKETGRFCCYTKGHRAKCFGMGRGVDICAALTKDNDCMKGRVFVLSRRSKIGRFHFPVERS